MGSIVHEIYGNRALCMIRYRTLELAEYCYLLTGGFEFESNEQEVSYKSGIYHQKIWSNDTEQVGVIDVVCVPDKETAIEIADIVFENLKDNGRYSSFVLQSVFYDEEDNVWVVNYYPNNKNYIGEDCSIAISQKTAEILKVWAGE